MTNSPDCGVLFVATGSRYVRAAHAAARSVREHCGNLEIALATDLPEETQSDQFDRVIPIERGHYRSKVDVIAESPFDRTLYLDTDIRVLEDIRPIFALMDRFDVAMTHAHNRNVERTLQAWRHSLPDAFPQLNSGVMLFRKTQETTNLFRDWSRHFHEAGFKKDQVTLRELLWLSDLRVYVLPPEYNVRHARQIDYWRRDEAKPKILHMAIYNAPGANNSALVKQRLKEVRANFGAVMRMCRGTLTSVAFLGAHDRSKRSKTRR